MTVDYQVGDTRKVIAAIPPGSIDLVASSPPFLALRSYVPGDHESKGDEIGSEANPAAFIDTLLELTAEWGRVLALHGSIAIELGDTYSGSGGAGGDYTPGGLRENAPNFTGSAKFARNGRRAPGGQPYADTFKGGGPGGDGWPRAKSLALVPQLYAVALAYGINPLTGQPSPAGRWLVRNVVVWHRPNPAVGALGDKVRPSTSYIVIATRSPKRWFDLTAVRTPHKPGSDPERVRIGQKAIDCGNLTGFCPSNPAGAPPLDAWFDEYDGSHDTWTLTTQPSRLAHYAMWPAKLAERLILMMCPTHVCRVCGEPRRRIVAPYTLDAYRASTRPQTIRAVALADAAGLTDEHIAAVRAFGTSDTGKAPTLNTGAKALAAEAKNVLGGYFREFVQSTTATPTSTWSDCGHDDWRPGRVLDPFAGTGTTLAVAELHGRDGTGIDFDQRNRDLYPARYDECKRALFGTLPEIPGQIDLFQQPA